MVRPSTDVLARLAGVRAKRSNCACALALSLDGA
jgi:hypothetical protein